MPIPATKRSVPRRHVLTGQRTVTALSILGIGGTLGIGLMFGAEVSRLLLRLGFGISMLCAAGIVSLYTQDIRRMVMRRTLLTARIWKEIGIGVISALTLFVASLTIYTSKSDSYVINIIKDAPMVVLDTSPADQLKDGKYYFRVSMDVSGTSNILDYCYHFGQETTASTLSNKQIDGDFDRLVGNKLPRMIKNHFTCGDSQLNPGQRGIVTNPNGGIDKHTLDAIETGRMNVYIFFEIRYFDAQSKDRGIEYYSKLCRRYNYITQSFSLCDFHNINKGVEGG